MLPTSIFGLHYGFSDESIVRVMTDELTDCLKSCFDGGAINGLHLSDIFSEHHRDNLEFLRDFKNLKFFGLHDTDMPDISGIQYLENLEVLVVNTYWENCKTKLDFSYLPKLRECKIDWRNASNTLFDCTTIEELRLEYYSGKSFEPFTNLTELKRLFLLFPGFKSLVGIERLPKLSEFEIVSRRLESIDPLGLSQSIRDLSLNYCRKINNIDPLGKMSALKTLELEYMGDIESLKPLSACEALENLSFVERTKFIDGDLSVLVRLPRFRWLSAQNRRHYSPSVDEVREQINPSHTETPAKEREDIEDACKDHNAIGMFPSLGSDSAVMVSIDTRWDDSYRSCLLSCGVNGISLSEGISPGHRTGWRGDDLNFLEHIDHLKHFKIVDREIPDVSGIRYLRNLETLILITKSKTPIDLSWFPKLKSCFLKWNNGIKNLFEATSLEHLSLIDYPCENLAPFLRLTKLKTLQFTNGSIQDIKGISRLRNLKHLYMDPCHIESLEPLSENKRLKLLILRKCDKVDNIDPIGNLTELRNLNFNDVGDIESVKPLRNCSKLELLSITANILDGDLSPIAKLPHLTSVDFDDMDHYSHSLEDMERITIMNVPVDALAKLKKRQQ